LGFEKPDFSLRKKKKPGISGGQKFGGVELN
jgi:hypothetical protein